MIRPALVLLFVFALVLTGCSGTLPGPGAIGHPAQPPVDTTCLDGMPFVRSYTAIAGRYDPRLETDRQQLASTRSLESARSLLDDISATLGGYDGELEGLTPPPDFADGVDSLLGADQRLRDAARALAASTFGVTDQSAFSKAATERQSALHDLRLQVAFVTSECT